MKQAAGDKGVTVVVPVRPLRDLHHSHTFGDLGVSELRRNNEHSPLSSEDSGNCIPAVPGWPG